MEFSELVKTRYSVRKFAPKPVGREALQLVLEAGRLAPTARNQQPQRILVLSGQESLEKLDRCTQCRFGAPAALLVCYDRTACWKRERFDGKPSGEIDCAIVTTHMMLQAAAAGLGSTWVMHFDPAAVRREFALPEQYEPVAVLVLGYPAEDAAPAPAHAEKKPMEALVFENAF